MRFWRDRDITDRLVADRRFRKRDKPNDTQLAGGVGFWVDGPPEYFED